MASWRPAKTAARAPAEQISPRRPAAAVGCVAQSRPGTAGHTLRGQRTAQTRAKPACPQRCSQADAARHLGVGPGSNGSRTTSISGCRAVFFCPEQSRRGHRAAALRPKKKCRRPPCGARRPGRSIAASGRLPSCTTHPRDTRTGCRPAPRRIGGWAMNGLMRPAVGQALVPRRLRRCRRAPTRASPSGDRGQRGRWCRPGGAGRKMQVDQGLAAASTVVSGRLGQPNVGEARRT
jgi:hypothetical protein